MSLLHVLVLLAMLSTVLIAAAKYRQTKHQHDELAFTLSQTGLLLNHAHSYRMAMGDWRRDRRNCQLVLNEQEINGFGQIVSCSFPDAVSDTDVGDRLGLVQWVPNHYEDLFKSHFESDEIEDFSGARPSHVPTGYSGVVVLTDVNGGTGKRLDLVDFSDIEGGTSTTSELDCDGSSPDEFLVVNSFCARVYPQRKVWGGGVVLCTEYVIPAHAFIYNGIQFDLDLRSSGLRSSYLMYRNISGGHYSDNTYNGSAPDPMTCSIPGHYWLYARPSMIDENSDGISNADSECAGQIASTRAAIFQACH